MTPFSQVRVRLGLKMLQREQNRRSGGCLVTVLLLASSILYATLNTPLASAFLTRERPATGRFQRKQDTTSTTTTTTSSCLYSALKFKNFDDVLDSFHEETLLIYFGTSKCGPCQLMKKELALAKRIIVQEEHKKLKIFSLDTEKWPHLGTRYGVQRLPCLLVVRNGTVKKRMEGVTKADLIVKELHELT